MSKFKDPILNRPIRQAVLERIASGEIGWADIAKDRKHTSGVQRQLGHIPWKPGEEPREQMEYEEAVRVTRAAGLDPVDVGL